MWLDNDTTPARVAPTRVYRWERDEDSYDRDGGMLLCADDGRTPDAAFVAHYWYDAITCDWDWMAYTPSDRLIAEGECATEDAARRACELAVLHGEVR